MNGWSKYFRRKGLSLAASFSTAFESSARVGSGLEKAVAPTLRRTTGFQQNNLLSKDYAASHIAISSLRKKILLLTSTRAFSSIGQEQLHKRRRNLWPWVTTFLGVPLTIAGAWVVAGDDSRLRLKLLWNVPLRLGRDAVTAAAIAADYKYSLWGLALKSREREEAKHEAHLRGANRLQALCFENGGIYIKLGQHIGQLEHLLPEEYVMTMREVMLDKCPVSTYEQICKIFTADFGKTPEEMFSEFDREPLASASLAQVHRARLHSGEKVAVKVQHGHLTETAMADLYSVSLVVNLVHWFFPAFDYRWLVDEVRESIPVELNFMCEAKNNERCMNNFRKKSPYLLPRVATPKVFLDLSTARVLTMEFMEGVGVTDVQAIKSLGLQPADVAQLVSTVFSEMMFRHGFVHCDPHAANMLVRPAQTKRLWPLGGGRPRAELVLLDHGLYRAIDDNLRLNYAGLWKSLVFADLDGVRRYALAVGAGDDLYRLFASMLTMQTWQEIGNASVDHLNVSKDQKGAIQMYAQQYVTEISELLHRLPRVVLLLLKTNDCLRAVDSALGAPINTFLIVGRESTKALAEAKAATRKIPVWGDVIIYAEMTKVEFFIWTLNAFSLVAPTWLWIEQQVARMLRVITRSL